MVSKNLKQTAKKGRFGDTELVHVNKTEKSLLESIGGAGTTNPKTGLKEYFFWAPILASAALGAGASALTGKDPLTGALLGGLTGGIGQALTPASVAASEAVKQGATNAITPALTGAATTGPAAAQLAANQAVQQGATNLMAKAVPSMGQTLAPMTSAGGQILGASVAQQPSLLSQVGTQIGNQLKSPLTWLGMSATSALGGTQNNLDTDENDPEYKKSASLNRRVVAPMDIKNYGRNPEQIQFMADGGKVYEREYNKARELMRNRYIKGKGDGKSDSIPARLSDGEYVLNADVVTALGNGSNDAGAKKIDSMVEEIMNKRYKTKKLPEIKVAKR